MDLCKSIIRYYIELFVNWLQSYNILRFELARGISFVSRAINIDLNLGHRFLDMKIKQLENFYDSRLDSKGIWWLAFCNRVWHASRSRGELITSTMGDIDRLSQPKFNS